MFDRRRIRKDRSEFLSALRLLSIPVAVIAGVLLGWKMFLSPQPSSALSGSPTPDIPVQTTAVPSSRLSQAVRVGSPAPDFTLPDIHGTPTSLGAYEGNVVLINFWTTWCPPCRTEMPALQEAFDKYQNQGFTILAINVIELDDVEEIEPFVLELGLTFPILLDEDTSVSEDLFNIIGLPTSVFVGRDGTVREIFIGALQLENLEAKIISLLEEAA